MEASGKMELNRKTIKRRERRFYRVYENGDIKYTEAPNRKTQETPMTEPSTRLQDTQVKAELTEAEKKKIIDKILLEMKNTINPDIEEISDVIYSQLSNNNISISPETVKLIVQKNVHNRCSRRGVVSNTTTKTESTEKLDYLNDWKEMELVVDDIVEENIKERTRESNKPNIDTSVSGNEKPEKKEMNHQRARYAKAEEKQANTKKVEEKQVDTKKVEEKKPKPKKEDLTLDFEEDESEFDSDDEENELGLKF